MTQAIKIREAGAEELDEVENLVKTAYREFQPLMPAAAWNGWMDNISETIHAPDGVVLVAGDQGRIEGAVKFYPDAAPGPPGAVAGRGRLHPAAGRGSRQPGPGYGRLLTQACLDRARELCRSPPFSCTPGPLWPRPAISMKNWGFKRAPEFDRDPGPIAYRLDLV